MDGLDHGPGGDEVGGGERDGSYEELERGGLGGWWMGRERILIFGGSGWPCRLIGFLAWRWRPGRRRFGEMVVLVSGGGEGEDEDK